MRLAITAADSDPAREASERLSKRYPTVPPEEADAIVALGGDGFLLQMLHRHIDRRVPIYGMNRGSIGFLLNEYREDKLPERVAAAAKVHLHPLRMSAQKRDGTTEVALAINEVSLLRQTRETAKLRISIDDVERMAELSCDGVIVATAAGSTAYNLSAHGPILPLNSQLLALTPISAFRPRRWRGALLPHTARVTFEILEAAKRPVSATADQTEVRNVTRVDVREDAEITLTLLYDPAHNLEERVLKEQFEP